MLPLTTSGATVKRSPTSDLLTNHPLRVLHHFRGFKLATFAISSRPILEDLIEFGNTRQDLTVASPPASSSNFKSLSDLQPFQQQ